MSKATLTYEVLDNMIQRLNEKKRALATLVRTGQLTNAERHEQFNQFYVKTLTEVVQANGGAASSDYQRGYNTGYQTASRKS